MFMSQFACTVGHCDYIMEMQNKSVLTNTSLVTYCTSAYDLHRCNTFPWTFIWSMLLVHLTSNLLKKLSLSFHFDVCLKLWASINPENKHTCSTESQCNNTTMLLLHQLWPLYKHTHRFTHTPGQMQNTQWSTQQDINTEQCLQMWTEGK